MTKVDYDSYTRELGEALRVLYKKLDALRVVMEDDSRVYAQDEFFKIVVLFEQRLNMSCFGSFDRVMDFIEGKMSYEEMIRQLDDLYILQRD